MIKRNAKKARVPKFNARGIYVHYETKRSEGNAWIEGTGGSKLTLEAIRDIQDEIRKSDDLEADDYVIIKNIMGL